MAEEASHYSLSLEISLGYDGLSTAIDEASWQDLLPKTLGGRMPFLKTVAGYYDRQRHQKSIRGPKKPPPQKSKYRNGHHLSVKKILDARTTTETCWKPCPEGVETMDLSVDTSLGDDTLK